MALVRATLVEGYNPDQPRASNGRFGSGGAGASKKAAGPQRQAPPARATLAPKKPGFTPRQVSVPPEKSPTGKYKGFHYVLPTHGQSIFRKAGHAAGRQAEALGATSMAQIQREAVRAVLSDMRASKPSVVRAMLVPEEEFAGSEDVTPVRSEMIDPGADHTERVPDKAFVDDLDRKLKLKKVMGKHDDNDKKIGAPKAQGVFSHQDEADEERPPEGMQWDKEDPKVNYRYSADPDRSCGNCMHFNEPGSCEIIAGLIRRVDTCDMFHKEPGVTRAQLVGLTGEAFKPPKPRTPHGLVMRNFKRTTRGHFSAVAHGRDARRAGVQVAQTVESVLVEVSPKGYEKVVRSLKKNKSVRNPWALAWWMKGQGIKPGSGKKKESLLDEGGPGSGRRPEGRSKFAPDAHDDEDPATAKFTRREKPAQRTARIRAMLVPKDRAAVIRRAFSGEGEMGNMGDRSTIRGIGEAVAR